MLPANQLTDQSGGGAERWLEPGTEYAKTLPLDPEWYEGLGLGGLQANGQSGSGADAGANLGATLFRF